MDDFKIGDIIVPICNLSKFKSCDKDIWKVGKIIEIINYKEMITTSFYYGKEEFDKLIRVSFYDKSQALFISKEIIKCSL